MTCLSYFFIQLSLKLSSQNSYMFWIYFTYFWRTVSVSDTEHRSLVQFTVLSNVLNNNIDVNNVCLQLELFNKEEFLPLDPTQDLIFPPELIVRNIFKFFTKYRNFSKCEPFFHCAHLLMFWTVCRLMIIERW